MDTTTNHAQLPDGRRVFFAPRSVINADRPRRAAYRTPPSLPAVPLPIDWSKGGKLDFPMLGNDKAGCCMYAAGCHLDQAFTGNVGTESTYDEAAVLKHYYPLSGGDNGLNEGQLTAEWHRGLCGNPDASILDSLDIDTTDAGLVNSAIYLFGGVLFMLSVPNPWINKFVSGCTWDAPATPNPRNGHGTAWVGVNEKGDRRLLTWGGFSWLTQRGVESCDPSGFIVFSKRWFNPSTGLAPNGFTYDQLAAMWEEAGGSKLPPSPFKTDLPPA